MERELKEDRHHHEIISLTFSKETFSRLRWEHEREFEYSGMMYDLLSLCEDEQGFHIVCWADNYESELKEKYSHHHQEKKTESTYLKSIFIQPYLVSTIGLDLSLSEVCFAHTNWSPGKHFISRADVLPETPPPKVSSC